MCAHVRTLYEPQPTAVHGADPAPRGHGLMRRLWSEEAGALATMHTNIRSVCSVKGRANAHPPRVPETPSKLPLPNSSASVLPDLPACVGLWKKLCKASARCTSMDDETTCTSEVINENVSNRLRARARQSSEQQRTFVRCTRSEILSAVSTLKRASRIDMSHDDRGHADLAVVLFRDGLDGSTRFEEILFRFHQ